jgi:hypothetical protein
MWISRLHVKRFLFGILQKFQDLALLLSGGQCLEFIVFWAMLIHSLHILVLVSWSFGEFLGGYVGQHPISYGAYTFIYVQFFHCSCLYIFDVFLPKINPKMRLCFVVLISTLLIQILILGVRSRTRFLLCFLERKWDLGILTSVFHEKLLKLLRRRLTSQTS